MRTRTPWVLAALLVAAGCSNNSLPTNNYCITPFAVGPSFTDGICGASELCTPSSLAPCNSTNCCHEFCSVMGCTPGAACITLTLSELPDSGIPICACDGGSECTCGPDGGPCVLNSCLEICGN